MNEAESESFEFSSARRGVEGARDPSITGHFAEIIRMQMRADDIAGREGEKSPFLRVPRWSSDERVKLARASRVISISKILPFSLFPLRANFIHFSDFSLRVIARLEGRSKLINYLNVEELN